MYSLEKIVNYCKQTGFVYQGSEIYNGLANTWDYGPLGALLKNNIKKLWIKHFCSESKLNCLIDTGILMNQKVWEASGHLANFSDPLTECKVCNVRYRADNLISNALDVEIENLSNADLDNILISGKIKCPNCQSSNFSTIKSFNMMFQTFQGVSLDSANKIFLRPETAQGIFINFKNILRTTRKKIPFGVCQVGKSFRNEITPGNFIFRTREFEQMELEFFCKPNTELEWFNYWKNEMDIFLQKLGIPSHLLKDYEHPKEVLSHYSNKTTDILFQFPWGFEELWGIASRTNFDLLAHEGASGVSLKYQDPETNGFYTPYVVEPSVGVERLFLALISCSLTTEELPNNETREVLKIVPALAPYKACILPLIKKEHSVYANILFDNLSKHFECTYDETQAIGKRYRRQDQIGTPFCITVDHQSLIDDTVTIRHRDTMEQVRVSKDEITNFVKINTKF